VSNLCCGIRLILRISSPAAEKHAAFVQARGRHYSNEAEAMKVRYPLSLHRDGAILKLVVLASTSTHGGRRGNFQLG